MIRGFFLLIDEDVGASAIYSDMALSPQIGQYDNAAVQVIVDNTVGTADGSITVTAEHSGDGEFWTTNMTVLTGAVTLGARTPLYGNATMSLPLARFNVQVSGLTAAHVKLYVVARDPSG